MLEVRDVHVSVEQREILKGVSLSVLPGETVALMGPNGSGKSTLGNAIMGNPKYKVTSGDIRFLGKSILECTPDQRSLLGIFLSFQHPHEVPGVTVAHFLRMAKNAHMTGDEKISVMEFRGLLSEKMNLLGIDPSFASRYLNLGFSGGEKKRLEMLQLALLEPKFAILDETDSGLDIDALKAVAESVNAMRNQDRSFLIITHYQRILEYIKPDRVLVMVDGKVLHEGTSSLLHEIEQKGYAWLTDAPAKVKR